MKCTKQHAIDPAMKRKWKHKVMARYIGLLDGAEGAYGIVIPDLPGCTAGGDTIADVTSDAIAAVREWVLAAREDGEEIPSPRDMVALRAEKEVADALREGAALIVIPVLINSGRPAKARRASDGAEACRGARNDGGEERSAARATRRGHTMTLNAAITRLHKLRCWR